MGILDEEAHGRVDLQIFTGALGDAVNVLPSSIGSARRRPGFEDVGAPRYADRPCVLLPFRRSAEDQSIIELGDLYARFWSASGGQIQSGGTPYEVAVGYPFSALSGVRFDRTNDVVYLTHDSRAYAPVALQRYAPDDWAVVPVELRNGPWRTENADTGKTIACSALVGSVTLTASFEAFTNEMVGELVRLRLADGQPSCGSWTPGTDYKASELVQSDGKLYVAQPSDRKSGTAAPIHDQGAVSDGNLVWTYLSDGAGVVRIDSVSSPFAAVGTVIRTLPGWTIGGDGRTRCANPAGINFPATTRWAFGAFSNRLGWPGHVAMTDDDRVAVSGSRSEPGVYHLTRTAGYGPAHWDFTPGLGSGRVVDDDAIRKPIKGGADPITWLIQAGPLMFGTSGRAGVIMAATIEEALSPADNRARGVTSEGTSPVPPAAAHDGVLFVNRGDRGVTFLKASADEGVVEADLSLFVEDLVAERLAGIVWAGQPDRVAWLWTREGSLLSLTYQPRQNQFGWARHPLPGGFRVESAAVITDGDGRDVVWLAVVRTKGGAVQRRIWRQVRRWRTGDPLTEIRYLDAHHTYAGPPQATLGGLGHLAGETVRVFGNGGRLIFDATVSGAGTVTAPEGETLTAAVVGLRYHSEGEGLPLDIGGPGASLGQKQRVTRIQVQLADAVQAEVSFGDGPVELVGDRPWGEHPEPVALVFQAPVGGETTRDARWRVKTDDCWPMSIRSVRATVSTDD